MQSPSLSIRDTGFALSISRDTVRRYLRAGFLEGFRLPGINGHWRIYRESIDRIRTGSEAQERG